MKKRIIKRAVELSIAAILLAMIILIFIKQGGGNKAIITLSIIGCVIIAGYIVYLLVGRMLVRKWHNEHPDASKIYMMYEPKMRKVTYIQVYSVDGEAPMTFGNPYSVDGRGIYLTPGLHLVEMQCIASGNWFQANNREYGKEVLEINVQEGVDYKCEYSLDSHDYYLQLA